MGDDTAKLKGQPEKGILKIEGTTRENSERVVYLAMDEHKLPFKKKPVSSLMTINVKGAMPRFSHPEKSSLN